MPTMNGNHAELDVTASISGRNSFSFKIGDRVERKQTINAGFVPPGDNEQGTVVQAGDETCIAVRWDTQRLPSLIDGGRLKSVSAPMRRGEAVSPFWSQDPYTTSSTLPGKSGAETYLIFLDGQPELTWNVDASDVVLGMLIRMQERGRNVLMLPVRNNPTFDGLVATGILD